MPPASFRPTQNKLGWDNLSALLSPAQAACAVALRPRLGRLQAEAGIRSPWSMEGGAPSLVNPPIIPHNPPLTVCVHTRLRTGPAAGSGFSAATVAGLCALPSLALEFTGVLRAPKPTGTNWPLSVLPCFASPIRPGRGRALSCSPRPGRPPGFCNRHAQPCVVAWLDWRGFLTLIKKIGRAHV